MAYNSDYFNLEDWKITLPVDSTGGISGRATEISNLMGYESAYFFDAPDGAMVFRADVSGATTSGSIYARAELREMNDGNLAAWSLSQGGTLSATLKIDEVPTKTDGTPGRIIIGQIHGKDEELVRLNFEKGKLYFMNDHAGPDNKELKFIFKNSAGQEPSISLGEKFSYLIDARGNTLTVEIFADGQIYRSSTSINDIWQTDSFYFKAGLYLGVNESTGSGNGQVSFYGLDFGHVEGSGRGGWQATPVPDPEPLSSIKGNDLDNQLMGSDSADLMEGRGGNDVLHGGGGHDELWGNDGNDVLVGGLGNDVLKGGPGQDKFVFTHFSEAGDIILDFHGNYDRLDVSAILNNAPGLKNGSVFKDGFLQVLQKDADAEVYIDKDGAGGTAQKTLLFTLKNYDIATVKESSFILPQDTMPDEEDLPFIDTTDPLTIVGNGSANVLFGGYGNDTIKGNGGYDTLYGGDGNDYLEGNAGNDKLIGGHGNDKMKGGSGTDMYIYTDIEDFGDTITEFRKGERINLSAIQEDFSGADGLTSSQMVAGGYLSFSRLSSTKVNIFADLDGAGSDAPSLIASLTVESGYNPDHNIFIV